MISVYAFDKIQFFFSQITICSNVFYSGNQVTDDELWYHLRDFDKNAFGLLSSFRRRKSALRQWCGNQIRVFGLRLIGQSSFL